MVNKETSRCERWITEGIWIRKTEPTMNRDEGGGLQTKSRVGQSARHAIWRAVATEHSVPEEGRRWWSKHRSKSNIASCVIMPFIWNNMLST